MIFALFLLTTDATASDYKILTDGSSTTLKSGSEGRLAVKVVALNGFHVSDEAPFSVTVTPPAGLAFGATKLGRDKGQKDPQATTTFTAKDKGKQSVKADLVFFLCTEKLCQRMTSQTELSVLVN